jgi:hypothetical protein
MLQITADVFSGRPNPAWTVTDEAEVRSIMREITRNRALIADAAPETAGLGFRGVMVAPLSDDLTQDFDVPARAYIALGAGGVAGSGIEIVDRLIGLIPKAEMSADAGPDAMALDESLQSFLREQMVLSSRMSTLDGVATAEDEAVAAEAVRAVCYYDTSPYNPNFWNTDPTVRSSNNCYNYASNKRTNTFAQPGRGCGHMYTALSCAEVTRAALCDRLHRRYDCFPDSEYPRYLVALVMAPSVDFHWYRLMREGFWAHKPGGTAVRNVDNCGKVIYNPATCCRGIYTQFCGYFYTCRSQLIR